MGHHHPCAVRPGADEEPIGLWQLKLFAGVPNLGPQMVSDHSFAIDHHPECRLGHRTAHQLRGIELQFFDHVKSKLGRFESEVMYELFHRQYRVVHIGPFAYLHIHGVQCSRDRWQVDEGSQPFISLQSMMLEAAPCK